MKSVYFLVFTNEETVLVREHGDAKIKGKSDEDEDLGQMHDFQEHEDNSFSIKKNKKSEYDRFTQFQERVGDRVHTKYTASLH